MAFENVAITVKRRPLYDVMGRPITPYPLTVNAVIQHWCDLDLALAWFSYMAWAANAGHTGEALDAFCQGCNALNVVWWNIPQARALYRKWVAGPPMSVNGVWDLFVFGSDENYGGSYEPSRLTSGWFGEGGEAPVTHADPLPNGIIPRLARRLFDRYYWPGTDTGKNHPTTFIPSVGFQLKPAPGTGFIGSGGRTWYDLSVDARSLLVELANQVQNTHWIMSEGVGCDPLVSYPVLCNLKNARGAYYIDNAGAEHVLSNQADMERLARIEGTAFRFGKAFAEVDGRMTLPASPGYDEYLPYLRELAAAMTAESPIDLIQDSRAFVVYQNFESVRLFHGSLQGYLAQVFGTSERVYAAWTTPDPVAEMASTAAYTIGGALATSTYGVSAIVGGAIGAGIRIADAASVHTTVQKKDDLGRYKPTYERAWCAGDQDPNNLAMGRPPVELRTPPGYVRIPYLGNLDGALSGMSLSCAQYLALSREDRIVRVGAMVQGGTYVPPTDLTEARRLSTLVDALNVHCVRVGFSGPPNLARPGGTPQIDDPYGEPSSWGPWVVGGLLVAALWRIFA